MPETLTGLIAAAHTPMNSDGTIHDAVIRQQARLFESNPVTGAFVCGTTGEGKLLSLEERRTVTETWVHSTALPVIVHVGEEALGHACALARHAAETGAYAIASMAPSFFRPATVEDLVDYCAEIAAAAPRLPFYYYHIPSMNQVLFPMIDFLQTAASRIPTLAGIKYTHLDFADLVQCLRFQGGHYRILFGRDECLLAALACGVDGAVGSTYNYAAPLYHQLMQDFARGNLDDARERQAEAIGMIQVLTRYNEIAVGKHIMSTLGVACGPVRRPLHNLSAPQREDIVASMEPYRPRFCRLPG